MSAVLPKSRNLLYLQNACQIGYPQIDTNDSIDLTELHIKTKYPKSIHPLYYDVAWYTGGATAKIKVDGQEIVSGTVGTYTWKPSSDGVYHLTLNVYNDLGEVVGSDSTFCLGREDLKDLVIPRGVTEIGAYAFAGGQFTSVTIPSSVKNRLFGHKCGSLQAA